MKKPSNAPSRTEQKLTQSAFLSRRAFVTSLGSAVCLDHAGWLAAEDAHVPTASGSLNLARVALGSSPTANSENKISALNDELQPASSADRSHPLFAFERDADSGETGSWVEYTWSEPVPIDRVEVYWAVDLPRPGHPTGGGFVPLTAPASYRLLYWDGTYLTPVAQAIGYGVVSDQFNSTRFTPVTTNRLRLEVTTKDPDGAGILEWQVFSSGVVPRLAPLVRAGLDRSVVVGGRTYLSGSATFLRGPQAGDVTRWSKRSGPGRVSFADVSAPVTTATFSVPGDYVLSLSGGGHGPRGESQIEVHAEAPPPADRLNVVYTRRYSISNPFWSARAKSLIVDWIPHCVAYCERTDIAAGKGDGGLDNFVEAGKALRGEPHAKHRGYVFSNAWVHQTVESMCLALMVDPQGDPEILAAQAKMHDTLERWIPIILGAQMPDGYLQTAYTLADRASWPRRWMPEHRGNHEGYVSGYFIESAINHYTLTDGQDLRLYNAAKRLADCWVAHIGPGKQPWFDGHQEMEQALVRFGRFVNDQEGGGRGDSYIVLAKFLLDSRRGGSEYDQSHLPPAQQYEAVGHAVRAMYFYSGMADIAAETGDRDYQSAVLSLWSNMVHRKYYLTGGIGSGETSEGFGPNYSLRNDSYCESCSSCGLVFFQYKLNLAYHDAKYADLYEQTLYNALLGGVALDGKSFTYTNPLVNTERARWHDCPCCVGNIPRTLLMMPTWAYVKSPEGVYVNLYLGSRVRVGQVAGTDVEMVQDTDYPWKGSVALTVQPAETRTFSVFLRVPNRTTSRLYTDSPRLSGLTSLRVNGQQTPVTISKGYVELRRTWRAGDRIELEMPMTPQRVTPDPRIQADLGTTALKYGPLVYNVETADQTHIDQSLGDAPLGAEWRPELLGGVMVVTGTWQDGSSLTAVPNFARMNRVGPPGEYPRAETVDYAPGATTSTGAETASASKVTASPPIPVIATSQRGKGDVKAADDRQYGRRKRVDSKVWI